MVLMMKMEGAIAHNEEIGKIIQHMKCNSWMMKFDKKFINNSFY